MPNTLTPFQQAFIQEYRKTGYNATRAYCTLKPSLSYDVAKVNASQLLTNPNIQAALQQQLQQQDVTSLASREKLVAKSVEILEKTDAKEQYSTALKAIDQTARLMRYYETNPDESKGFNQLIQSLTVNVISSSQVGDTVDVIPDTSEDSVKSLPPVNQGNSGDETA